MTHIVLDTDVTSLSFKQQLQPALFAQLVGHPTCITFITLGELTQWADMHSWGQPRRTALTCQHPWRLPHSMRRTTRRDDVE